MKRFCKLSQYSVAVLLFGIAACAQATDFSIYTDTLQNSFLDYSYGGGSNFAATTPVHSGANSIAFTGNNSNAVSFDHETQALNTTQYPLLHFWVHGGSGGGQHLRLDLQLNGSIVANAVLDTYITGGAIGANAWREVTVNFSLPPLSYSGGFDRIDLQSDVAGTQPVLYLDDLALQTAVVDHIFSNGFESTVIAPAANGMLIEHDVTVAAMVSDRFTWRDSGNKPRVAVLAHNDGQSGPNAGTYQNRGGALREFRYQLPDNSTRIADVTTYGNGGYGGFGYVVSHSSNQFCNGDDSPLGYSIPGTFQRVFEGRHHAIFRFTQNYTHNCSPAGPAQTTLVPVTIDWVFSTGHDHPLWAITHDLSAVAADYLNDDSRAPYGELNIDGQGFTDIDGVAWGDRYKFTSTTAPVTLNSAWTWNTPNTVPYVKLWLVTNDATMGTVQSQNIVQQDAGGYFSVTAMWNKTSVTAGANCEGATYKMPCIDYWPYQSINFNLGPNTSNNNSRLAWGTEYGFLGQTSYHIHGSTYWGGPLPDATQPGWPKKSYSTYIVLGTHSSGPVEAQVTQVETVQGISMTAAIGAVVGSGPAGVNRSDTMTYAPAGYDAVRGALALAAAGNQLDANIAVASGTLKKPLLIVSNYSGAYPTTVRLNGVVLVIDQDYFPSLRGDAQELWITLNSDLTGVSNHFEILP